MTPRPPPAQQLPLGLEHNPAMSRADFLSGQGNAAAVALIDRWPEWPERGVLLTGPAGSGKSHLVEIWRQRSGADRIAAADLDESAATRLTAGTAAAVEDLDAGPADDRALFHLINLATERRVPLLMTSRLSPGALETGLADLTSRLRALHHVELAGPDDDLLRRVLFKLFADRQLVVDPAVIDYIVVRLERSLEAANLIVAQVDADALAEGRGITKRLAGEVLDRLKAARQDSSPEGE